jgi:ribosomal protein S19E (S16A)
MIFLDKIVLRRINLRRIYEKYNCSEKDISRNNGSKEDICEKDFSKKKASGEIQSEVMTCMSRYFNCR